MLEQTRLLSQVLANRGKEAQRSNAVGAVAPGGFTASQFEGDMTQAPVYKTD